MTGVQKPFLMVVEDVFSLRQGRALMATGRIERGRVRAGDEVEIVGFGDCPTSRVTGIEAFPRSRVPEATAGMNVALLLPGTAGTVERGHVLAAPGSIAAHTAFVADLAPLSGEQGGTELSTGDTLAFHLHAAVVRGTVTLPGDLDTLRPLHTAAVTVTLEHPVALENGRPFAFRHHGRAAGTGTVVRLLR
ncbi:EF-Tu C-terminal domain-related protein [Streptomyces sp. NPDC001595]|uniref:EF-Tu C-terminal domain-related protein n=1 Tax=Streptomyces sp. NPDC001532 TaxID=3154520 RepID=UPI00332E846D